MKPTVVVDEMFPEGTCKNFFSFSHHLLYPDDIYCFGAGAGSYMEDEVVCIVLHATFRIHYINFLVI